MFAFAVGLLISMVRSAWFGLPGERGLIGFFGFGVPLIVSGLGTAILWYQDEQLREVFGWTSTINGCIHGLCLLILVGTHVFGESSAIDGIWHFFGFGLPMLACGVFGIAMLTLD
jgi:hypothetical protein